MARYSRIALVTLLAVSAMAETALAGEATMRMRGGTQTFTGDMISFDGESYLVETPVFGKVYLDASRFECISGACPASEVGDTVAAPAENAVPAGNEVTPRQDFGQEPQKLSKEKLSEDRQRQLFMQFLEWRKGRAN